MEIHTAIEILELNNVYTIDDVKRKHKELATKFHPDKEGGSNEKMTLLNQAKELLLEKEKISKNYSLAVIDVKKELIQQKNTEKKVEKIEKEIFNYVIKRKRNQRNFAFILLAISSALIFLGKDIPKEILLTNLTKPNVVQKPIENDQILKFKSLNIDTQKLILENKSSEIVNLNFTDIDMIKIRKYLDDNDNYKSYLAELDYYESKEKESLNFWYFLTFGLGIYSGIFGWFLNLKIIENETKLNELNDDLTFRTSYISILREIFNNKIPDSWTITDLINNIAYCRISYSLNLKIEPDKFARLIILKGQEQLFLNVKEGNSANNYQDEYSLK